MISIRFVPTFTTSMYSFGKFFFARMRVALGTSLRRSIWVDSEEVDLMFFGYPFQQIEELTKSGIQGVFSQHPSRHRFQVQILNKHHPDTFFGTQMVSQLELPVFPNASNVVVERSHLNSSFLAVLRTLFRSGILALQQFQLAVQGCQESGSSDKLSMRGCQEFLQSQINTNGITMRLSVWYRYIRLYRDYYLPPIRFPQYPCLLGHKPFWDGSVQVDGHLPDFGESNLPPCNRVGFELGKQHGRHLSKLLETWKAKPSLLEVVPSIMQSTNGCLQNLRRCFSQQREFFLRLGKRVLLSVIGGKRFVGWNDIFSFQRTIIQTTFTRIHPIFDFSQSVVVRLTRNFQPMQHCLLLGGVGINSVAVVHNQCHSANSNTELAVYKLSPVADFTGIDRIKSAWGSPCIPTLTWVQVQRGTYSSPKPPQELNPHSASTNGF